MKRWKKRERERGTHTTNSMIKLLQVQGCHSLPRFLGFLPIKTTSLPIASVLEVGTIRNLLDPK